RLVDGDLRGTNLRDAKLNNADLSRVRLQPLVIDAQRSIHSSLDGARLRYTNLSNAILRGVSLRGADLSYANLTDADLRGADLSGARLYS
ncbi:pentapeptide repeat-containing protein, partial [Klebsiella pneumoniae]|uniref:pentapeptide repeat-containing protein n=1 Tax=Klebsiella pneumoniae TaxID=573 RepID=UPI0038545722